MILNFGKYKGMEMEDVPTDYLAWIVVEHSNSIIQKAAFDILKKEYGFTYYSEAETLLDWPEEGYPEGPEW